MSILWPERRQVIDRKFHEAGVRGRFETNLRVLRGIIDTTAPTVIAGEGFTVQHNATGDITITFDPQFDSTPSVIPVADQTLGDAGIVVTIAGHLTPTTNTTVRLRRFDQTGTAVDGYLHFTATGPI